MIITGMYRGLYLVNWSWRYYYEGFFDLISIVAGVVQTMLYCTFYFYMIVVPRSNPDLQGKNLSLPSRDGRSESNIPINSGCQLISTDSIC